MELGPAGLTFERFGNLFVWTESNGQEPDYPQIQSETESKTRSHRPHCPSGLGVCRSGNLFVAETIQDGPGDILKFTPNGIGALFASGIGPGADGGPSTSRSSFCQLRDRFQRHT
jgi:hypothetical protein